MVSEPNVADCPTFTISAVACALTLSSACNLAAPAGSQALGRSIGVISGDDGGIEVSGGSSGGSGSWTGACPSSCHGSCNGGNCCSCIGGSWARAYAGTISPAAASQPRLIGSAASARPDPPRHPPGSGASPVHSRPSGPHPRTHLAAPAKPPRSFPPASSASPGSRPHCRPGRASARAAAGSFAERWQPAAALLPAIRRLAAAVLTAFRAIQVGDAEDELAQQLLQADRALGDGDHLTRLQVHLITTR